MLSIIIVNYNSGNFLFNCLRSINDYAGDNYEVIVVDNNSNDNSVHQCVRDFHGERYKYVMLDSNVGFAKANNIGVMHSKGDVFHFLNPDTELRKGMSSDYSVCFDNLNAIYVNKLQNMDGTYVPSKNLIPVLGNYLKKLFHISNVGYWYTGASVIISKENFNRIGKWNENYFMYSEDLDLFYNAHKNNITTIFLNNVISHVGGGSSSQIWDNYEREVRVQQSLKQFYVLNGLKYQYPYILLIKFFKTLLISPSKSLFLVRVWINVNFKSSIIR